MALEGLACGCLPIVSDTGGLPDAIGDSGLTFKTGDSSALAEFIRMVITKKDIEDRFLKSAKVHLSKSTSREISKKYLSLIEGLT